MLRRLFSRTKPSPGNRKLVEAMREVSGNDNPKSRRQLYQALLGGTFLIPTAGSTEESSRKKKITLTPGSRHQFITMRDAEGMVGVPVFTDSNALLAWRPQGSQYLELHARDVFSLALANNIDRIIVNVAGPTGGEITRAEIQALSEEALPEFGESDFTGLASVEVSNDTPVYIGAPAKKPSSELIARIGEALASQALIKAGYLFQVVIGKGQPHLTVGIQFSILPEKQDLDEIMRHLLEAARPALGQGEYVDFMVLNKEDLLNTVRSYVQPVFQQEDINDSA